MAKGLTETLGYHEKLLKLADASGADRKAFVVKCLAAELFMMDYESMLSEGGTEKMVTETVQAALGIKEKTTRCAVCGETSAEMQHICRVCADELMEKEAQYILFDMVRSAYEKYRQAIEAEEKAGAYIRWSALYEALVKTGWEKEYLKWQEEIDFKEEQ